MAVYGDIRHDSRVQREANSLAKFGYDVTIFCLAGSREEMPQLDEGVVISAWSKAKGTIGPGSPSPFRRLRPRSALARSVSKATWLANYAWNLRAWGRAITSHTPPFDVWHAHDFTGLVAVGASIRKDAALIYDIHDLFLETGTGALLPAGLRGLIRRFESNLMRRVDLAIAVNQHLADIVEERCVPRSMIIVHNCPPRWTPPKARPDLIRKATGISSEAPIILYHGLLGANRGIDRLLEAILHPDLAEAHLALMGYGELGPDLVVAAKEVRFGGRVHILDPVAPADLLPWVASADVGAMAMPRSSLNLYVSTPNKLFECLAAGTPVVVSDFPAVREIVRGDPLGPLGVTCDPSDVGDVVRAIGALLATDNSERAAIRERCNTAARDRWNWELEAEKLIAGYESLANSTRFN